MLRSELANLLGSDGCWSSLAPPPLSADRPSHAPSGAVTTVKWTGAAAEPDWHRTARARRSRARRTQRAVKAGLTIEEGRLVVARNLMFCHHGAGGSAVDGMANGPSKTGADGFTTVGAGRKIAQNEWRCDKCSEKDRPYWNWAKRTCCHLCDKKRPQNPTLCSSTEAGKM